MGGRGASSKMGSSGGGGGTPAQQHLMRNMERVLSERRGSSAPMFTQNRDGSISYKYTETRTYWEAKGGKMISPDKNDLYERVTTHTGTIYKDGLRKANKPTKVETLIKRGRLPRRKQS